MRVSFAGRVAGALMLLALGGYATAQERLTLRIADQKGGMRSQLEAANALQNLPYDIKWAEFPAAAPLAEALNAGAVDAGIIGYYMAKRGQNFDDGDGIVTAGIEATIRNVGRLAKEGMKETNDEIISIMIGS